jgi:hypothetical protein
MKLNSHIYLLEEYSKVCIEDIYRYIKAESSILNQVYKLKIKPGQIVFSFESSEKEFFEHLVGIILEKFNYDINEFHVASFNHIHLELFNSDSEMTHSFTAYHTDEYIWEFYYSDGHFLDILTPKEGTVTEEMYFIFKTHIDGDENVENIFIPICEKWVKDFGEL